ncbi:MAG: hypothetical protein NZ988_02825 [Thaumarchaeota archaeon]|nr:hypothetical protein [Candidatus Calditenuaceae archaeon]MDW8186965.1 hypothetical protein [Nitrososphaerota archaeon]
MDESVSRALDSCARFLAEPSVNSVRVLIDSLRVLSPPGIEWGIELLDVAGTRYVLEGGRVTVVRLSRDDFGPFMRTQVRELEVEDVPEEVLKALLRDPKGLMSSIVSQLERWTQTAHPNRELRERVRELLRGLSELLRDAEGP